MNMETNDKKVQNDNNFITKLTNKITGKKNVDFTAEYAYIETTYGRGSYRSVEDRIKAKQSLIRNKIEEHFRSRSAEMNTIIPSYYCLAFIEDDIKEYTDEIFNPFKERGFNIVKINEIEDDNVYVVSWKHVFSQKEK